MNVVAGEGSTAYHLFSHLHDHIPINGGCESLPYKWIIEWGELVVDGHNENCWPPRSIERQPGDVCPKRSDW